MEPQALIKVPGARESEYKGGAEREGVAQRCQRGGELSHRDSHARQSLRDDGPWWSQGSMEPRWSQWVDSPPSNKDELRSGKLEVEPGSLMEPA